MKNVDLENDKITAETEEVSEDKPLRPKFTGKEWRTKILLELRDLLAGAAFPLMLMVILSATILNFIGMFGEKDLGLKILILIVGEVLLIAAYVIFGRQNGTTAYKKTVANTNKRKLNSSDVRSRLYAGEYAVVKGILIAVLSCVPLIIVLIIEASYHNQVTQFMLMYVFGWAYYPFNMMGQPVILNLIWIIPLAAVHTAAYIWGGKKEKKRQEIIEIAEESKAKRKKK